MAVNGGYRVQHISPGEETNFQHGAGCRNNSTIRNRYENETETRAQKLQYGDRIGGRKRRLLGRTN